MSVTGPDIVGFVGVGCVVGTYFLSQIDRMDVHRPLYPAINGVGALFILFSLLHMPNKASIVIEFFWLGISLVGFVRALVRGDGRQVEDEKPVVKARSDQIAE